MIVFLISVLLIGFWLERSSIQNALKGVEYDVELSRKMVEVGETVDMITTLRMTRRRFAPFVRMAEEVPAEFETEAKKTVGALNVRQARIVSSTYLLPRQKVTRRISGSFPKRGRYTFNGAQLYGGDFLGLSMQMEETPLLREVVALPKPLKAPDVIETLGGFLGEVSVNRFILEDPVLTLGFREYTGREPMKDISWPTTARANRLMVKRFDYTLELSVSVILNVDTEAENAGELCERCFSLARSVCEALEEKRVKYAFYTNSLAAGKSDAWTYIGEGLGGYHLLSILDGLGRATETRLFRAGALLDGAGQRAEAGRAHVIVTPTRGDIDPYDLQTLKARTGAEALVIAAEEVAGE